MARVAERLAVVGVGLIGGSLAGAVRRRGLAGEVVGLGRTAGNLAVARARGLVDRTDSEPAAVAGADLVVLAVPLAQTAAVVATLAPHLAPGAVVSDVGSVKAPIVAAVPPCLPASCAFVGAHPIAGAETGGAAHADPELFVGARCVLTPTAATPAAARERVAALWRAVGAEVEVMSPAAHDRALAWTSHVPHVVAYALAAALERADPGIWRYAGPSLRDLTRVAASRPALWEEILTANADHVGSALAALEEEIAALRAVLGDPPALRRRLDAGHRARVAGLADDDGGDA